MNALQTASAQPVTAIPTTPRVALVGLLRMLLIGEAVATLALAIFLSLLAGDAAEAAEESLRFAAGGAFLFAIFAAVASRGARRRRGWAWTLTAILQVLLAVGIGLAVMVADWHPLFLVGFAAAAVVMLVLSSTSVRRTLGKE